MTEKELSGLKPLIRIGELLESYLEQLREDLRELESGMGVKSQQFKHGSKGKMGFDVSDLAVKIADLKKNISKTEIIIIYNLSSIQLERARLEIFIEDIKDPEISLIFRLKYINGMSWREIGDEMHMSYNTARRKHKKYLQKIVTNVT